MRGAGIPMDRAAVSLPLTAKKALPNLHLDKLTPANNIRTMMARLR